MMRLKDRLSLALTLVTGAVLGVSFLVVSVLVRREETEDLDRAILSQATTAAFLALQKDPQKPRVLEGSGHIPELPAPVRRYEAIYGTDGQVLSATRTFEGDVPRLEQFGVPVSLPGEGMVVELTVRGNHLRGVVLPFGEGNKFRILYALTRRSVDDDLRFLGEVFTGLFLAALVITGVFSRLLGARLAREVDLLARVAQAVARGELGVRVGSRTQGSLELRQLGEDMDRMIVQLGELMASQRTFVSHAAHELRSPLATLRGQLQLALRRTRSAEEYRETIEDSLGEVESLIALAEDLLVLARVQGGPSIQDSSVLLGDLVRDAMRMARGFAEARGILFEELLPEDVMGLRVRGARADLARALRNLIDNAVTHSPAQGLVRLEATLREGAVEVAVCDHGAGVPSGDIAKLFSPFFRGSKEQSGEIQGTGLGLTIVREIARSTGGDVFLDTDHRSGARFVLVLSLAPP